MACSYDEDVCSNEFKLLCGENVRAVNATFPCERPSGSSASTPLGSSLHRHPISTLPLVPGGASRPAAGGQGMFAAEACSSRGRGWQGRQEDAETVGAGNALIHADRLRLCSDCVMDLGCLRMEMVWTLLSR